MFSLRLVIFGCVICGLVPIAQSAGQDFEGLARIVDGDSLKVSGQSVRLDGIDAPELGQSCRDAKGERYRCGEVARTALTNYIAGQKVTCDIDYRDRYNRAVGVCYVGDREAINGWLVDNGHALAYRQFGTKYVPAEERAHESKLGLWAGVFVAPWHWRRGVRLGRDANPEALKVLQLYDDNRDGKITCTEAIRHDIAPVRKNDAAYRFMRDGDGDGVVCR